MAACTTLAAGGTTVVWAWRRSAATAAECRDGGGYEAWTSEHKYDDDVQIAQIVTLEDVMEDM